MDFNNPGPTLTIVLSALSALFAVLAVMGSMPL